MCNGVGKTHTMLQDAVARRADGVDVVVGWVNTRDQPDTERLMLALPYLASRPEPQASAPADFDLDAALRRRPQLIVVDDLARANPAGVRHLQRFQDVVELLEAGIDVYGAVNVQNVESRSDAAAQITGVPVSQTIPDSLIERADEIELIDISPDELLKRFADGKVSLEGQMDPASAGLFYRKGNLTALREMALRLTAEHVDRQMGAYMRDKDIRGPWRSHERLLAAVDGSASGDRVVRWTHRMAFRMRAPWMVVHVDTANVGDVSRSASVEAQLELARTLGAEVVVTNAGDPAEALTRIARQHNVSQIVVGRAAHRRAWMRPFRPSTAERLTAAGHGIDICIAAADHEVLKPGLAGGRAATATSPATDYLRALGLTLLAAAACWPFREWLGYQSIALLLLFAVLLMALRFRRGPTLLAGAASALCWNFLFIPPIFTLAIHSLDNVLMFFTYFAVSLVAGHLTSRIRERDIMMQVRESQAIASFEYARDLSQATTMADVIHVARKRIRLAFAADASFWLAAAGGGLAPVAAESTPLGQVEYEAAMWALEHQKPAGRFTATLAHAEGQFLPLLSPNGAVAVMGVQLADRLTTPQQELLASFARQTAIAVERERLDEAAKHQQLVKESERLSRTILNLVSHELRSPITVIRGAASSILEPGVNAETRQSLAQSIVNSSSRLNQLVENVLDMSRLESGTLRLALDWVDVHDLVHVIEQRAGAEITSHPLTVEVQETPPLPLVRLDFVMIEHVLWNLLGNSARHTPADTPISLRVWAEGGYVRLSVADTGPGMAGSDLPAAFDRFHSVAGKRSGGLGLGLSICKGLVEAHGGEISAANQRGGGFAITVKLPVHDQPAVPPADAEDL